MARTYRAFRSPGADAALHLIADKAEATLCGLPRTTLNAGEQITAGDVVCPDCLEWIRRRNTGDFKSVPRGVAT